jgi:UDP:flavonoid glycosyltransferase YjiC (YdhE family)
MARAVKAGYGIKIDFKNVTTESLTRANQKAIESPK